MSRGRERESKGVGKGEGKGGRKGKGSYRYFFFPHFEPWLIVTNRQSMTSVMLTTRTLQNTTMKQVGFSVYSGDNSLIVAAVRLSIDWTNKAERDLHLIGMHTHHVTDVQIVQSLQCTMKLSKVAHLQNCTQTRLIALWLVYILDFCLYFTAGHEW